MTADHGAVDPEMIERLRVAVRWLACEVQRLRNDGEEIELQREQWRRLLALFDKAIEGVDEEWEKTDEWKQLLRSRAALGSKEG